MGWISKFGVAVNPREVMRVIEGVEGVRDIVPDFRVVLEKVSVGEIH